MRTAARLALFIAFFLKACNNFVPTVAPEPTSTAVVTPTAQGVELYFETIEKAEVPGIQEENPKMFVIVTEEGIDTLGNTISQSAQDELRAVNFNNDFVVAVFQGLKGTNMYGVDIQRVVWDGNRITVFAHFTERNPELAAADVNTSPYHIIKVSKDGLQGEFDFFLNVDGDVILETTATL